eukprot:TRINITY_DN4576_c0_g1_i1.p1 TRINITY_DN4576_c0_g1~~TRINITY_DN4576_c0_g1_i1.p1  ORF type:complete len:265 (+),score=46.61 TRINITY_DN4576_c0_g1_i1:63-857(+)
MKLLGAPVAIAASTCATFAGLRALLLGFSSQEQLLEDELSSPPCEPQATVATCDGTALVGEQELKVTGTSASSVDSCVRVDHHPLVDLGEAVRRSSILLLDLAVYAKDGAASWIWQWPVDSASSAPALDVSPARDWLQQASHHVGKALNSKAAGGAVSSALNAGGSKLAGPVDIVRSAIGTLINGFLERHPEHKAALGVHDPLLVALGLVVFFFLAIWESWTCCRLGLRLVLAFGRLVLEPFTRAVRCVLGSAKPAKNLWHGAK